MEQQTLSPWFLAARFRTLPASLSPVLLACVLAYSHGCLRALPSLLCILVALLAQVASNFANDYYDYTRGADTEKRLGPPRAVASGLIPPRAMLSGALLTLGLACISGLCLVALTGEWWLIAVGAGIALCVLAYSAGPFPLAYNGLGDICVVIFYGIIPVMFTYYVQAGSFTPALWPLSIAIGLLSANILIVNNYRDYDEDLLARKRTTVVLFGQRFARRLYIINAIIALALVLPFFTRVFWQVDVLYGGYILLYIHTWRDMYRLRGRALNSLLGRTARNVFLFFILMSVAILCAPA
jgi:1,4-dihydroxy-2-naphthoate octaprenyltransferase